MQKVFLIGNVTANPETKQYQNGTITTFNIAVNDRDKNGENTTFYRINAWNRLGETCMKFLTKGSKVGVVGSLRAGAYINNAGDARPSLDVNADNIDFLGGGRGSNANTGKPVSNHPSPAKNGGGVDYDSTEEEDDLPF